MDPLAEIQIEHLKIPTQMSVFGCNLSGFGDALQSALQGLDEVREKYPESTPSNVKAVYMSPWKSHRLTQGLTPLIDILKGLIRKTSAEHLNTDLAHLNYELRVADCWYAVYEASDHTVAHSHFPSDFSSVVYLQVDEAGAPIVFANNIAVHPVSGTAVIFPGLLEHHVPATQGRRVVVAVNFIKIPKVYVELTETQGVGI